jgi:hypothetical protein
MRRTIGSTALLIATVLLACHAVFGLQISQIEFDLHLAAGTSGTYSFQVINNESAPQQVTVYLSDWTRTRTGDNDFVPLDGARWLFGRAFKAGDEIDLLYKVPLPDAPLPVSGDFMTADPASHGTVAGPDPLSPDDIGKPTSETSAAGPVSVSREVVSQDPSSHTLTVRLHVLIRQAVTGLRIDEVFSRHVTVTNVDDGGAEFTTVARSNGDWLTVSPQRFQIDPGKTQEVTFSIRVPADADGTTWGMIFVEGSPRAQQRQGATVLAVERFGVKVYETVPGTEDHAGRIVGVDILEEHPLTVRIAFENTGNIQMHPRGKIDIISRSGDVVRSLSIESFPILPGATRELTVTDPSSAPLPAGIYRALATIDYGGQALAGGTRDFQVK